jgi:ribosomal protein S18 acetylase RimI-like enzyme
MADVLDLRQFRASHLEALLAAESREWHDLLHWDYAPSADLIRQYVDARILPGYVLLESPTTRATPLGYGFFIYEARKGMIGNLFVAPEHRDPAHSRERLLLEHMIATMRASPGLERIEAQLMPFPSGALAPAFLAHGFQRFRRVFLELRLPPLAAEPAPPAVTRFGDLRLEPWGAASFDEAARLIQLAYRDHVDSRINDQYRSFAGAVRFMHNIAHYPGCGTFDPSSSYFARAASGFGNGHRLEGMILASRVRADVAHITQVCVLPERQHQGLGRALLARCLAQLARHRLAEATLTVTADNTAALALYRQLGFVPIAEFDAFVWERRA